MQTIWGNSFYAAILDGYVPREEKGQVLTRMIELGIFSPGASEEVFVKCGTICSSYVLSSFVRKAMLPSHEHDSVAFEILQGTRLCQRVIERVSSAMADPDWSQKCHRQLTDLLLKHAATMTPDVPGRNSK